VSVKRNTLINHQPEIKSRRRAVVLEIYRIKLLRPSYKTIMIGSSAWALLLHLVVLLGFVVPLFRAETSVESTFVEWFVANGGVALGVDVGSFDGMGRLSTK
jgi:hypothetical protein